MKQILYPEDLNSTIKSMSPLVRDKMHCDLLRAIELTRGHTMGSVKEINLSLAFIYVSFLYDRNSEMYKKAEEQTNYIPSDFVNAVRSAFIRVSTDLISEIKSI